MEMDLMKMDVMKKKKRKGFTLIELIVVIAILGILAAIAIPKFSGFTSTAKEQADKSNGASLKNAFAIERSNGTFTNTKKIVIDIDGAGTAGKAIAVADVTLTTVGIAADEKTPITAAAAWTIVHNFLPDLKSESGKDIEITLDAGDGAISAKIK